MFAKRIAALAAPAILLLALTGCSGGGDGGSASKTACLAGKTWSLDVADAAAQLAANLATNGLDVVQSVGSGTETFRFDADGSARATIDLTYTITIDNGDGLTITLVQTHSGSPTGEWAWRGDSSTITFSDWDNSGYSVKTTTVINGVNSDSPIDLPNEDLGGTDMDAQCSGSTLTTKVAVSPFTNHWTARG